MSEKIKFSVLFVCTGNSCRSQMAEGLLREISGGKIEVKSAGSIPASRVSPYAVEVMKEIGIDISAHYPKSLESMSEYEFDWVITLCDFAEKWCPIFYSKSGIAYRVHWPIEDPHGAASDENELLKIYRECRDELKEKIIKWYEAEQKLRGTAD
jgi:arsenate reductase (thioredoxin)